MFVAIDTPYADTTAADLGFALGLAPQPALHTLDLSLGGYGVQLRLLGASHQVIVDDLSETVACLPGVRRSLPSTMEHGGGYRFEANTERLPAQDFQARVAQVRALVESAETGLLGVFPGGPLAVTALLAEPLSDGGIGWRTWHAYPQTGELVTTRTAYGVTR
jgi:hypothetical protein